MRKTILLRRCLNSRRVAVNGESVRACRTNEANVACQDVLSALSPLQLQQRFLELFQFPLFSLHKSPSLITLIIYYSNKIISNSQSKDKSHAKRSKNSPIRKQERRFGRNFESKINLERSEKVYNCKIWTRSFASRF